MNGYEAAFRGAMGAYGKLAVNGRRWLLHVTGTGGDSEAHYWPNDCEVCKEIARFVDEWKPEAAQQQRQADALPVCVCPADGMPNAFCPIHGAQATGRSLR